MWSAGGLIAASEATNGWRCGSWRGPRSLPGGRVLFGSAADLLIDGEDRPGIARTQVQGERAQLVVPGNVLGEEQHPARYYSPGL